MKKKKKAVVAGHICLDITPIFPKKAVTEVTLDKNIDAEPKARTKPGADLNLETIIAPGKLLHMEGVNIHTGGSVANTGLAMKLLGVDVSLMGKVGRDDLGALVLSRLKKYGADAGMICAESADTSYSVVLAIPGVDRIFLHSPGANDTFSCEDLNFSLIGSADLFHFGYPTVMRKMYQNQGKELAQLLRMVKERQTATSLDLSAVDPSSEAAEADWSAILTKVLPYVDFFVPSAEELCFMLDPLRLAEWESRTTDGDIAKFLTIEDVRPLGEKVLQMGARMVLIKCGSAGMYCRTSASEVMTELCEQLDLSPDAWVGKECFETSYVPDAVISATGAGDTSIAAFLAAVLEGSKLKDALQMATATGACCVAAYDALSGLKPLEELREKIRASWQKNS